MTCIQLADENHSGRSKDKNNSKIPTHHEDVIMGDMHKKKTLLFFPASRFILLFGMRSRGRALTINTPHLGRILPHLSAQEGQSLAGVAAHSPKDLPRQIIPKGKLRHFVVRLNVARVKATD